MSICDYLLLHDRISYSVHISAFAHVVHVAFFNEGCGEKRSRTGSGITNEEGCKSLKRTLQLQPKILLWSWAVKTRDLIFYFFFKGMREKERDQKQLWMLRCGWCRNVGGDLCKNLGVGEHCFQVLLLLVLLRGNIKRMKKKWLYFVQSDQVITRKL